MFKGGYVGFRIYNSPRYTIDLDALLIESHLQKPLKRIKTAVEKDVGDGVWLRFEHTIDLQTQGLYGGTRYILRTGIGEIPKKLNKMQIIHFDLNVGDPIIPKPKKIITHELIGAEYLSWYVYPIETMIAEKIHALVERGGGSSRSKDIFDLTYFLPKANKALLKKALYTCFRHRKTTLPNDLAYYLKKIDLTLLKIGWPSAVSGIKNPPTCENAYKQLIKELKQV